MKAKSIRQYGDPVLRQKAAKITSFDHDLKNTVDDMFGIMFEAEGIGLAAPQVGIPQAFFIVGMPRENQEPEKMFFANPQILEAKGELSFEEGCLSVPGIREEVDRPEWIRLKYQNLNGEVCTLETGDLLARVLQHEIDHLQGILFIDRLSPVRKTLLKKPLKKLTKEKTINKSIDF